MPFALGPTLSLQRNLIERLEAQAIDQGDESEIILSSSELEARILNTVLWALLTGGVTGAVWMGIVLLQRQRRLTVEHRELLEDRQRTLDELETLSNRLAELQDRQDFVERHLRTAQEQERPRLPEQER